MTVTADTTECRADLRAHFMRVADDATQAMFLDMADKAPRDTGEMTNTLTVDNEDSDTLIARRVGAPVEYASWQNEGTGIYAGGGRIYPTNAKALHFYWRKMGVTVTFASVAGTPATHWWDNAIAKWPDFVAAALG